MSHALKMPPLGFSELPVEEQIEYVQALWDMIAAHPENVPVPAWHEQIIDERLADHDRNPAGAMPWEEFRAELESGSKRR